MEGQASYRRQVQAEFNVWVERLVMRNGVTVPAADSKPFKPDWAEGLIRRVFPAPGEPGWLPDGWVSVTSVSNSARQVSVVRPTAGGWALVHWNGWTQSLSLVACDPTLGELYKRACLRAGSPEYKTRAMWMPVEEALRHYIAAAYDPSDPVEAGEQMLVALGGRPVRRPTALT